MTNSEQLKAVITALGGSPSGDTNAELLAQIVTLLGGTASGNSNADMIEGIADVADTNVHIGASQNKTVAPGTTAKNVTADTGKVLNKVTVSAVTASIDANIVAENIKSGVTILGVTGTYTGEPAAEPDVEPSE